MALVSLPRSEQYLIPTMPMERTPNLNDRSDAVLVRLAQQDVAYFAPLYERYFDRVYAYCLRRVSLPQEAEDLCSQIFTRALRGLPTFRPGYDFAPWLFTIAHHVLVDYYTDRQRTDAQIITLEDADGTAETLIDPLALPDDSRLDNAALIQTLLADLTPDQRDLLALSVDAELTSQEIGMLRGKSAGAVRVQLHRLFKQLRARYLQLDLTHLTGEE